jgi:NitT/TauT family transport system permease protein
MEALKTKPDYKIFIPPVILAADFYLHTILPNIQTTDILGAYKLLLAVLFTANIVIMLISVWQEKLRIKLSFYAPLAVAGALLLGLWDTFTLKTNILPLPYYPGPDKVLGVFYGEGPRLLVCLFYSLKLLFTGYFIGVILGIVSGIAMGWNKKAHYWLNPLIKIIGPIPATAWIPIAMNAFPTSFMAGAFLIALGVWFPVTVMTSSGISDVKNSYFEVAKTLGAGERFLIFKVAVPAAYPMIFIGLFMVMGMSFVTLIVAEMLGVKAGLGWFINWAQGWGEESKVYAALIVIALVFSFLLSLLFKVKDKILIWQRGLIKW